MFESGDVVLAKVQFSNTQDIKIRPALVLYENNDNVIVAGITTNKKFKGIPLLKKEGAPKISYIKLSYIFTISKSLISKKLFCLDHKKKKLIYKEIKKKLIKLKK